MVANTGKENISNKRKKFCVPWSQGALCQVDCLTGIPSRPDGSYWSARSKVVLIGLRHLKTDVLVVHSLPNVMLIAGRVQILQWWGSKSTRVQQSNVHLAAQQHPWHFGYAAKIFGDTTWRAAVGLDVKCFFCGVCDGCGESNEDHLRSSWPVVSVASDWRTSATSAIAWCTRFPIAINTVIAAAAAVLEVGSRRQGSSSLLKQWSFPDWIKGGGRCISLVLLLWLDIWKSWKPG